MAIETNRIAYNSQIRSKPVDDNFNILTSGLNDLQNQLDASLTPPAGSEVTNARDYASVLRDRLRGASKITGNALISGGEVTQQGTPNNTVIINAGTALIDGVYCNWTTSNSPTIVSHPTNPRIDVVVINSDNTKSIITGVASATPEIPIWSTTQKILASIYVLAGSTIIYTNNITEYYGIELIQADDIYMRNMQGDAIVANTVTSFNFTGDLTGNVTNNYSSGGSLTPIGSIIGVHPDVKSTLGLDENIWSPCDGVALLPTANFNTSNDTKVPDLTDDRFLMGGSHSVPSYGVGGQNTINLYHSHKWNEVVNDSGGTYHIVSTSFAQTAGAWNASNAFIPFGASTLATTDYYTQSSLQPSQSILPKYFKVKYYMRIK